MEIILKTGVTVRLNVQLPKYIGSFHLKMMFVKNNDSLLLHHCKKGWRSVLDPAFIGYATLRRSPVLTRQPHVPPTMERATIKPILWGYLSRRICRGYGYQLKWHFFLFFFCGKIQWDIIYIPQNSLLGVCFAHFLAHLFRNQPQSNFIKLLLTLKETLIYWWEDRRSNINLVREGGTNYLMSDGSRMYCTIGGT